MVIKMDVEQEVEVVCPHCGEEFVTVVNIEVESPGPRINEGYL